MSKLNNKHYKLLYRKGYGVCKNVVDDLSKFIIFRRNKNLDIVGRAESVSESIKFIDDCVKDKE